MTKTSDLAPNAFAGRLEPPADCDLAAALGRSAGALWNQLIEGLAAKQLAWEWHSYSAKAGWTLRLRKGKRNVAYLSPCAGSFRAAFVLGSGAREAALAADLPAEIRTFVSDAPHYPEGFGVRIPVTRAADIAAVIRIAEIKLAS